MSLCTIAVDFVVAGLQNRLISGMVSSVGSAAIVIFGTVALGAIITALTAARFSFKLCKRIQQIFKQIKAIIGCV